MTLSEARQQYLAALIEWHELGKHGASQAEQLDACRRYIDATMAYEGHPDYVSPLAHARGLQTMVGDDVEA